MFTTIQEFIDFFAKVNGENGKINIERGLLPKAKHTITQQILPQDLILPEGVIGMYVYEFTAINRIEIKNLLLVIQQSNGQSRQFSCPVDRDQYKSIRLFLRTNCQAITEERVGSIDLEFKSDLLSPSPEYKGDCRGENLLTYGFEIYEVYDELHHQLTSQLVVLLSNYTQCSQKPTINLVVMGCGFGIESLACAKEASKLGFQVNLLLSDYSEKNVEIARETIKEALKLKTYKNIKVVLHPADINNINEILGIKYSSYLSQPDCINILVSSSGGFSLHIMQEENQRRTLQILRTLYRHTIHHILAVGLTPPLFHSDMGRLGFYQTTHLAPANEGKSHIIQLDRVAALEPIFPQDGVLDLSAQPMGRVLRSLHQEHKHDEDIHTVSLAFCDIDANNVSELALLLSRLQGLKSTILDRDFELKPQIYQQLSNVIILGKNETVLHAFFGVNAFNNTFEPGLGQPRQRPVLNCQHFFNPRREIALPQVRLQEASKVMTLGEICSQLMLSKEEIDTFEERLNSMELLKESKSCDALLINARSEDGTTPLMTAAQINIPRLTACLLHHGADASAHTNDGSSNVLTECLCDLSPLENMKMLLELGVDANGTFDVNPLMVAIEMGNSDKAILLIEYGADLAKLDLWGKTALHNAVSKGLPNVVKRLIEYGADLEALDGEGKTALFYAVSQNNPNFEILYYLILAGAEFNKPGQNLLDHVGCFSYVEEMTDVIQAALSIRMTSLAMLLGVPKVMGLIADYVSPAMPTPKTVRVESGLFALRPEETVDLPKQADRGSYLVM